MAFEGLKEAMALSRKIDFVRKQTIIPQMRRDALVAELLEEQKRLLEGAQQKPLK